MVVGGAVWSSRVLMLSPHSRTQRTPRHLHSLVSRCLTCAPLASVVPWETAGSDCNGFGRGSSPWGSWERQVITCAEPLLNPLCKDGDGTVGALATAQHHPTRP